VFTRAFGHTLPDSHSGGAEVVVREMKWAAHRIAFLATGLLLAATLFAAPARDVRAQSTGSPIADTALKYVGTHGGQCWTFMQQVVAEATGIQVGFGYREGYFAAGAVEVSADEATAGDIIQIASDASSGGSYPGLHTAIILENLGGGVFNAVDSNQNWDEMVQLRPNYNPYEAAARYGLDVHIYRIPGGSAANSSIQVSAPAPIATGASARVDTGGGCLNLRTQPSLNGGRITCLPNGTAVTVVSEPVAADGYAWVQVQTALGNGWVASTYLSGIEPASPAPAAVAAEPTPPPAADPQPVAAAAAPEPPVNWIHTDNTPGCLRLRAEAGLGGAILDCLPAGTAVTLISDASIPADGYVWVNVRTERGNSGWVASEHLVP